jgi:hypothetical protein
MLCAMVYIGMGVSIATIGCLTYIMVQSEPLDPVNPAIKVVIFSLLILSQIFNVISLLKQRKNFLNLTALVQDITPTLRTYHL